MSTLTNDNVRLFGESGIEELPVVAADIIFEGSAVGADGNGFSRPLEAGDVFQGFAKTKVDNSTGAAGAKRVSLRTKGLVSLPIAGLTITANERPPVFASDDDTFTLTAGSNSLIGYLSRFESAGVGIVEFDVALVRAALQA